MVYKVIYRTFAMMGDNKIGNVEQSRDTLYTDKEIKDIKGIIDARLEEKDRVSEIIIIEQLSGHLIH